MSIAQENKFPVKNIFDVAALIHILKCVAGESLDWNLVDEMLA